MILFSGFPLLIADGITGLNFTSGNNGEFRIDKASNNWTIKTNVSLDFETVSFFYIIINDSYYHKKYLRLQIYVYVFWRKRGEREKRERLLPIQISL